MGSRAVDPNSPPSSPKILYPGDARLQTIIALKESIKAVQALGGKGPESIARVKMFVSRSEDCSAVGEGFREVLGKYNGQDIGAAATMIVVHNGFIDENMLVEVEVDAFAD